MSKRVDDSALESLGANQVSVVEDDCAVAPETQHGANMTDDCGAALAHQGRGIVVAHAADVFEASA